MLLNQTTEISKNILHKNSKYVITFEIFSDHLSRQGWREHAVCHHVRRELRQAKQVETDETSEEDIIGQRAKSDISFDKKSDGNRMTNKFVWNFYATEDD